MVCVTDVDGYKQYVSPVKSGMLGGRTLRKSKKKEREQREIGMVMKER